MYLGGLGLLDNKTFKKKLFKQQGSGNQCQTLYRDNGITNNGDILVFVIIRSW